VLPCLWVRADGEQVIGIGRLPDSQSEPSGHNRLEVVGHGFRLPHESCDR
jgi:hypothetical protein